MNQPDRWEYTETPALGARYFLGPVLIAMVIFTINDPSSSDA